jgi:hypothetical protein
VPETVTPWGLMLTVKNYGRDEAEARRLWGQSLLKLSALVAVLLQGFPIEEALVGT